MVRKSEKKNFFQACYGDLCMTYPKVKCQIYKYKSLLF